jgi:branched-chain amino acid transport system substrate-binding protein
VRHTRPTPSLALVVTLFSSAMGVSCGSPPDPPPEIRIGLLALFSGMSQETSGVPSVEGAELAIREVNAAGGIVLAGVAHRANLIVKSYEDRPDSATSVARALINQSRIDVLVGPQLSRHAVPVARVAEDAQIPMLSPMSSSPATTRGKRFVFRLAFVDDAQGTVLGRFAAKDLGARRAAVLFDTSTEYARSLADSFRAAFESAGGTLVASESFARDEPLDYGAQLDRIGQAKPDVLFLPNDSERVLAQIRQSRASGIGATLLGGDTWDLEQFRFVPEANGSFVAHQWHPELDTAEARRFRESYEEAYGTTPKVTAAMTYDAVHLVLRVIERQGSREAEAIRAGLASLASFTGATGTIRYRAGPDPERSVVIAHLLDQRNLLYRVVDPE